MIKAKILFFVFIQICDPNSGYPRKFKNYHLNLYLSWISQFLSRKSSDLKKKKKGFQFSPGLPPGWLDYDYEGCTSFFGSFYIVPRFSNSSPIPPLVIFPPLRFPIPPPSQVAHFEKHRINL